jgi:hypothetical protein
MLKPNLLQNSRPDGSVLPAVIPFSANQQTAHRRRHVYLHCDQNRIGLPHKTKNGVIKDRPQKTHLERHSGQIARHAARHELQRAGREHL